MIFYFGLKLKLTLPPGSYKPTQSRYGGILLFRPTLGEHKKATTSRGLGFTEIAILTK
jgi:hypothetical protein